MHLLLVPPPGDLVQRLPYTSASRAWLAVASEKSVLDALQNFLPTAGDGDKCFARSTCPLGRLARLAQPCIHVPRPADGDRCFGRSTCPHRLGVPVVLQNSLAGTADGDRCFARSTCPHRPCLDMPSSADGERCFARSTSPRGPGT